MVTIVLNQTSYSLYSKQVELNNKIPGCFFLVKQIISMCDIEWGTDL